MSDKLKKDVSTRQEIMDDDLELINGGYIPENVWKKMNRDERREAQQKSFAKWTLDMVCPELDDGVVCHDWDYVLNR